MRHHIYQLGTLPASQVGPESDMIAQALTGKVLCGTCNRWNEFIKCRLVNKTKNRWLRGGCGVKQTTLRRKLGGWPSAAFQQLSEDRGVAGPLSGLPLCVNDVGIVFLGQAGFKNTRFGVG